MISGLFSIPLPERAPVAEGSAALSMPATSTGPLQFITGPENALVRIVAEAVSAEHSAYNPLIIYGATGTGKSALLQALVAQREPSRAAALIQTTGADFARAYANAVDTDAIADLRERYDRCKLLVIDDLHRLATKPAAQQELLHTFDRLDRRGGLLIASLRQMPAETRGLLPGLVSRLSAGLTVPLVAPEAAARRKIVEQIAATDEIALPPALIDRLANPPPALRTPFSTATQLRQAILQLASRAQSRRTAIDAALFDELAAEHAPEAKAVVRQITAAVAKHLGVPVSELKGPSRKQANVYARGLAMHLCRQLTGASYASIARAYGNRDHTTVMHACRRVAVLVESDAATRHIVDELTAQFTHSVPADFVASQKVEA